MSLSEDNHKSIVEFLAREFSRGEHRTCVKIELCHASPGARGRTLVTWDRAERPELFEGMANIEAMATQILRSAEEDADVNGVGAHRYEIRTEQHLNGRQSKAFKIVVEADDGSGNGMLPEGADSNGQIAQQMRHSEFMMRTVVQIVGTMTSTYQRQISQLSDENHRLSSDRGQMIRQIEEIKSEDDERSMRLILAQSADERKTEILQKMVLPLAPIILAKLVSGGKAGEGGIGGNSALATLMNSFFKSLRPEQLSTIASMMNTQQMMMLKEAADIAQANATASNATPERPSQPPATTTNHQGT